MNGLVKDLNIDTTNEKELSTICRHIAEIVYSDALTDKESLQIICYYGLDTGSGSNRERRNINQKNLDLVLQKIKQALHKLEGD